MTDYERFRDGWISDDEILDDEMELEGFHIEKTVSESVDDFDQLFEMIFAEANNA